MTTRRSRAKRQENVSKETHPPSLASKGKTTVCQSLPEDNIVISATEQELCVEYVYGAAL